MSIRNQTTNTQLFVQGKENVGKPSSHSNFNIWFGKLEIFFTTMYIIQKIRKQFVRHFRATWLIRYVEMAKSIFTSSKHRFAGVNFPPGNKNWQCTAITTMRIKQKQAQLTPDQNSTKNNLQSQRWKKICNPTGKTNWTSTKFQKLLDKRGQFSITIKNTDNLYKPQILTTAWINRERMVHHGGGNLKSKLSKRNWTSTKFQKLLQPTRSEFSVTI